MEKILVWQITPDPNGAFDFLIVNSAEQAGEAAARGAELSWDAGDRPGESYSVTCYEMLRTEFEALPEP